MIKIESAADFARIGLDYPTFGHYILMKDLNLSGNSWNLDGKTFTGTFDGNGHTISNFNISRSDLKTEENLGLFPIIGVDNTDPNNPKKGTIKNLTIEAANIIQEHSIFPLTSNQKHTYRAGVIAGWNKGGVIENCRVIDSHVKVYHNIQGAIKDEIYCGGIAGENNGKIEKCSFDKRDKSDNGHRLWGVRAESNSYLSSDFFGRPDMYTPKTLLSGGIVGLLNGSGASIADCYTDDDILITIDAYHVTQNGNIFGAGGIAWQAIDATISRCFSDAHIATTPDDASRQKSEGFITGHSTRTTYDTCYYSFPKTITGVNNNATPFGTSFVDNFKDKDMLDAFKMRGVWLCDENQEHPMLPDINLSNSIFLVSFKEKYADGFTR